MKNVNRTGAFFSGVFTLLFLGACSDQVLLNGEIVTNIGEAAPVLAEQASVTQNVLVIGGTKGIGLEVVKLAAERGHKVTAIARRPERMTFNHNNLETLVGNILDSKAIARLVQGQHVIVSAIGIGPTRDKVTVFSEGMANVLEAIREEGSDARIISVTGIGAGDSRGHGGFFYDKVFLPLALKTVYDDKDIQEQSLRSSEPDWTIVRPGFLTDDRSLGTYRVVGDMTGITSGKISRADVAHFVLAAMENGQYINKTVLLTN